MFPTPTLTVDLSAITANWNLLKSTFTGDETAAVVKADAYGLGMEPVATALERAGCHTFFVATLEEAVTLRAALPDVRILVFHGVQKGEEFAFVAHRIIPVLNSAEQIARWKLIAAEHVHAVSALHIDTAMARMGLQPDEFKALMARDPKILEACRVGLLLSHLACSPQPDHPLNARQLAVFNDACAFAPGIPASLCNSGGIMLDKKFHFNLGRPGCSLYGIAPQSPSPLAGEGRDGGGARVCSQLQAPLTQPSPAGGEGFNPMKQVATWYAPILMIRTLEREQPVGYGATQTLPKGTKIATVASGYADGYLRASTGHALGYVGEHKVKLVGRVTMDLLCFDVSNVADSKLHEGAPLTLLGDAGGIRVDDLAEAAGTIGYEVLTRIGPRVKRSYV
jgi:alanine racemase